MASLTTLSLYIPCDTTARSLGADQLVSAFFEQAKKLNIDLNIIRNGSRGLSFLEPLIEVEGVDGRYGFREVDLGDVETILESILEKKQSSHANYIGLINDFSPFKIQQRYTSVRMGVINPLDFKAYEKHGGLLGLKKALANSPQAIVDEIKQSGLRGRGGAAFPAGIKWQTVLDATGQNTSRQKFIICNADEGDSGAFADRLILEADPFMLIEGMVIAGLAVQAKKGYVYLRSEYPLAAEVFREALKIARERKLIGSCVLDSDKSFDIELRIGAGAYICGEETSLLESLEGKRGMVRPKPPLPALQGFMGSPTVVNNVVTLATVPRIMAEGAQSYRQLGTEQSSGTLLLQLSGNIRQGGLYEIPFGENLQQFLENVGGGTRGARPIKVLQVGGPLGAYLWSNELDISLDYESFAAANGMLGHGGVVVFDDQINMLDQARYAMQFCAVESCGKCTPCRIGSVRGTELIEQIQKGHEIDCRLALLEDLCETMEETSLCAMGGLTPLPVKSALKQLDPYFVRAEVEAND